VIKPKELTIVDGDGVSRTYILTNFDSVSGREIIACYPMSALPKVGDYTENKRIWLMLMSFVYAVTKEGKQVKLESEALIMNHVPDWEVGAKIEMAMMEKNCSFFRDGKALDFFDSVTQMLLKKLSEILTLSSHQLSQPEAQHSTNSEQSMT
jgi:hypothetical protein